MTQLFKETCVACSIDTIPLSRDEIESLMPEIEGWELINDDHINKLRRVFVTGDYTRSMTFTNEVAALAEEADHHPQLIVDYGAVTVIWWSHKIKGLHKNDFIMAAKTSALFLSIIRESLP